MISGKSVLNIDKIDTYEEMLAIDVSPSSLSDYYLKGNVGNSYSLSDIKSGRAVLVSDNPEEKLYIWDSQEGKIIVNPAVYIGSEPASEIIRSLNYLIPRASQHATNISRGGGFVAAAYSAYREYNPMSFDKGWFDYSPAVKNISKQANKYGDLERLNTIKAKKALGNDVNDAMAEFPKEWQSPQLKKYLKNSEKLTSAINKMKSYTKYKVGGVDSGAYIHREIVGGVYRQTIYISPEYSKLPDSLASNLAHEVGHGNYVRDHYVIPGQTKNRAEFLKKYIARASKDEGEAQLFAFEVKDEIAANSGERIPINASYSKMSKYSKVYENYLKNGNREQARSQMGALIGEYEAPSKATSQVKYNSYNSQWTARGNSKYDR